MKLSVGSVPTWSYMGCNTFWLNSVKISTALKGEEDREPPKVYSDSAKVECSELELGERLFWLLLVMMSFSSHMRSGDSEVVESGSIKCSGSPRRYSGNIASKAFVH